ncbi:hypothetical protein PoB_001419200 [Plakobranchus ocellatus]|uniref:Elongator complex protein 5 n=1 Tax=Plakobranchus ocellatus TaxID=259542 RepID=A0AAV3YZF1_9GAST|nr:hypothetical protein PoB_001419200 [Plakobranchus ocellatus]
MTDLCTPTLKLLSSKQSTIYRTLLSSIINDSPEMPDIVVRVGAHWRQQFTFSSRFHGQTELDLIYFVTMLEDLLRGQEKSRLILMTDTSENTGRHLMLNWIQSMLGRCAKLFLLCFERPPQFYENWLPESFRQKLICMNGSKDTDEGGEPKFSLLQVFQEVAQVEDVPTCVVIDSITLPALMRPVPVTCAYLHKLATADHVVQVATLVHRDVIDQHSCGLLEHNASSVIDLLPSPSGSGFACQIRHCRPTGKVFKTKEFFEFDDSFHIQNIGPLKLLPQTQPMPPPSSQEPDPAASLADLSFKLQLTDREREARSQVVLPYLKDGSGDETSTSKIIYQADEADDFDEEDPDDDLNI